MTLNIVSFNIPYPADYGGVIDVFNRIKTLHSMGVKIILHAFQYGRKVSPELEKYCSQVYYYKRHTGFWSHISLLPYIVKSRRSGLLLSRLLENDAPILFDGLHACYYLADRRLRNRCKIVRAHNIEHRYYYGLYRLPSSFFKKSFYLLESWKL
jgi:hypothetical protein